jgi:ADP-ribose pyrophosphatase
MKSLADYLSFAQAHPALFVDPPGGFTILLNEEKIREVEAEAAQRLEAQGLTAQWAQVGIAYQDQYIIILRDAVRFPDGSSGTCTRFGSQMESASGVAILPVYQGHILLIRHFRHETRTWHLEIPAGFGIKGFSNEENARRELGEEIGATISRLISLGQVHPDPESSSDVLELFYGELESYGGVEVHEGISELLMVTVMEFVRMIREYEITDPAAIVAYTRAKLKNLL